MKHAHIDTQEDGLVLRIEDRPVRVTSTARKRRLWAKRLANYCCRECGKPRDDGLKTRCRRCQNKANRYDKRWKQSRTAKW